MRIPRFKDEEVKLTNAQVSELANAVKSNPKVALHVAQHWSLEASTIIVDRSEKTTLLHLTVMHDEPAKWLVQCEPTLLSKTTDKDNWSAFHEAVENSKSAAQFALDYRRRFLDQSDSHPYNRETIRDVIKREWPGLSAQKPEGQVPEILNYVRAILRGS